MIVDNFDLVGDIVFDKEPLMNDGEHFHIVKIVARAKDIKCRAFTYINYFCQSKEHLMSLKDKIVKLCDTYHARAYISVNPLSIKTYTKSLIKKLTEVVEENKNYLLPFLYNSPEYNEAVNENKRRWEVDLDNVRGEKAAQPMIDEVKRTMIEGGEVFLIPTSTGSHLLTDHFNKEEFWKKFPEFRITENPPTLLYYGFAPDMPEEEN